MTLSESRKEKRGGPKRVEMENPREEETWRLSYYTAEVSFSLGFLPPPLRGGEGRERREGGIDLRWTSLVDLDLVVVVCSVNS